MTESRSSILCPFIFIAVLVGATGPALGKGAAAAEKKYMREVRSISASVYDTERKLHGAKTKEQSDKLRNRYYELLEREKKVLEELDTEMDAAIEADEDVADRWMKVYEKVEKETYEYRSETERNTRPIRVLISEICYFSKPQSLEWIEIANISEKPVDISRWQLVDGQSVRLRFPPKIPLLKPKQYAIVKLDDQQASVEHNEKTKKLIIHLPAKSILGDAGGHIALLNSSGWSFRPSSRNIEAYISWGYGPGLVLGAAIRANRWSDTFDGYLGTANHHFMVPPPGIRFLKPGGSLGWVGLYDKGAKKRTDLASWGIFTADEVTPGRQPVRRRPIIAPRWNADNPFKPVTRMDDNGRARLVVAEQEDQLASVLRQVFSDIECTRLVKEPKDEDVTLKPSMKYFWRAQNIYLDGARSPWSEVYIIESGGDE